MPIDSVKITITAGDRLRLPQAVLEDSEGEPVNLEGCTVAFRMVNYHTGDVAVDDQAAIKMQTDSAPSTWGRVTYAWQAGETSTAGLYRCWWIVSSGGLTSHFPPDGDFYILIEART
jgi:hypothetical protein